MRLAIFILLIATASLAACKESKPAPPSESAPAIQAAFDAPPPTGAKAKCPVSGETFTVKEDTERSTYEGAHFAFCCPDCKPDFDKDPAKFAHASKK